MPNAAPVAEVIGANFRARPSLLDWFKAVMSTAHFSSVFRWLAAGKTGQHRTFALFNGHWRGASRCSVSIVHFGDLLSVQFIFLNIWGTRPWPVPAKFI